MLMLSTSEDKLHAFFSFHKIFHLHDISVKPIVLGSVTLLKTIIFREHVNINRYCRGQCNIREKHHEAVAVARLQNVRI